MTNVRENIAKALAYYIERSEYKQADIARILGITKQSVSNWLKGTTAPDINTFAKLCDTLGVDPKDMFYFSENKPVVTNRVNQLLTYFETLNAEGQDKLLEYADDLVHSGKYKKSNHSQMVEKNA